MNAFHQGSFLGNSTESGAICLFFAVFIPFITNPILSFQSLCLLYPIFHIDENTHLNCSLSCVSPKEMRKRREHKKYQILFRFRKGTFRDSLWKNISHRKKISKCKVLVSNIFRYLCNGFRIFCEEIQEPDIGNRLMDQLKMDIIMTDCNVTASMTGDGGEAMDKSEETDAFEAEREPQIPTDAGWYVAVVRCNCENAIAQTIFDDLQRKNIWFEYWVPMRKEVYIEKRSNKRRSREKVLITTYVFCHISARRLNEIRFRPDVYKMLTMPGHREIYRVSDKELNGYRRIVENPDLPVTHCSGPLRKGQKVRITEGQMAGLEAYVQRISGKKVVIGNEIKYISGATIEIDRSFLDVIEDE